MTAASISMRKHCAGSAVSRRGRLIMWSFTAGLRTRFFVVRALQLRIDLGFTHDPACPRRRGNNTGPVPARSGSEELDQGPLFLVAQPVGIVLIGQQVAERAAQDGGNVEEQFDTGAFLAAFHIAEMAVVDVRQFTQAFQGEAGTFTHQPDSVSHTPNTCPSDTFPE